MNIFGIGTDIVNINRIKNLLSKKNSSFKKGYSLILKLVFAIKEKNKAECFAKRFAAKEALFKAVSQENKLKFKDVEIKNNKAGAPKIDIKGRSLNNLKKIFKIKSLKFTYLYQMTNHGLLLLL